MLKRSPHTFPQPPYTSAIPVHHNSPILVSCPPRPARDCGRPAQAVPTHISRPSAIHKKLQSPQPNISQAIHCSPCLADPHAPRIHIRAISPYVLRGSHILSPSSQNLDIGFDKTSVPGPANPQPIRPYKFLNPRLHLHGHGGHGPVCIRAQANSPRPAAGSPRSTHQTGLLKFPKPTTGGGHGRLRRRCVGVDVRGTNICHGSAWGRIVRSA